MDNHNPNGFGGQNFASEIGNYPVKVVALGGLDEMAHVILFSAMPPLVLSVAFVLNRLLISYFNKKMENETFVPVVDARGHVKGRSALTVASSDCSSRLMYPIVRIALTIEGMI